MSHFLDGCSSELMVPNTELVVLTGVFASKNNKKTTVFRFQHPQDVADGTDSYESIIWSHTIGATLNASDVIVDGKKKRMAVSVGGLQLKSLASAMGYKKEEIQTLMMSDRKKIVSLCELWVGLAVTCPFTGRVKDKEGVTRVQFKFPLLDFGTAEDFTDSLEAQSNVFGPSDLATDLYKEAARKRNTRPSTAVTPVGAMEGDELVV